MPYLTARDIIHIVSLAVVIAGFIYRIKQLEADCQQVKKTLYHEQGGLNIVSCAQCKTYRDDVFTAIRKGDSKVDEQTKELRILNERVLKIMIHLKIDNQNNIV